MSESDKDKNTFVDNNELSIDTAPDNVNRHDVVTLTYAVHSQEEPHLSFTGMTKVSSRAH